MDNQIDRHGNKKIHKYMKIDGEAGGNTCIDEYKVTLIERDRQTYRNRAVDRQK